MVVDWLDKGSFCVDKRVCQTTKDGDFVMIQGFDVSIGVKSQKGDEEQIEGKERP